MKNLKGKRDSPYPPLPPDPTPNPERNRFIEKHMPLARSIARKVWQERDQDEGVSAAYELLVKFADEFNFKKIPADGHRPIVRVGLRWRLMDYRRTVTGFAKRRKEREALAKAIKKLGKAHGNNFGPKEIRKELGLSPEEYEQLRYKLSPTKKLSLDLTTDEFDEGLYNLDLADLCVADWHSVGENPEKTVLRKEERDLINEMIDGLPPAENLACTLSFKKGLTRQEAIARGLYRSDRSPSIMSVALRSAARKIRKGLLIREAG